MIQYPSYLTRSSLPLAKNITESVHAAVTQIPSNLCTLITNYVTQDHKVDVLSMLDWFKSRIPYSMLEAMKKQMGPELATALEDTPTITMKVVQGSAPI